MGSEQGARDEAGCKRSEAHRRARSTGGMIQWPKESSIYSSHYIHIGAIYQAVGTIDCELDISTDPQ